MPVEVVTVNEGVALNEVVVRKVVNERVAGDEFNACVAVTRRRG